MKPYWPILLAFLLLQAQGIASLTQLLISEKYRS